MAVTPDSTTSASEPGLTLPALDQWLLKQPMDNRSHKLGNLPCQPVTNALLQLQGLAVADGLWALPGIITLFVCYWCISWIFLEMSRSQAFKCSWVWMFWVWDLSLANCERSLDKDFTWWVHFQVLFKFTIWVYWDPFWITLLMINTLHFLRITK